MCESVINLYGYLFPNEHIVNHNFFTRVNTYKDVQSSVQRDGLLREFGPPKVSPHLIPLHVLIYKCIQQNKKKD